MFIHYFFVCASRNRQIRYNSAEQHYEYIPSSPSLPAIRCLEERAAVALLRVEIHRLLKQLSFACVVFAYASEQLVAPLLDRLLAQSPEDQQQQSLLDRFGNVRLAEVFSEKDGKKVANLMELIRVRHIAADGGVVASLSDCCGSSQALYHLVRTSLGGDLSYNNFIRPFCRQLDRTTIAKSSALLEPSAANLHIFYSHLPDGQPAYKINAQSGDVFPTACSGSSTLLDVSFVSSEDDDRASEGSDAAPGQFSLRTVRSRQLMESVGFLNGGEGEDEEEERQEKSVELEDEPNQVNTFLLLRGRLLSLPGSKKK